ncbi:cobalamin-dependent protein [Candidatus Woesearchaeota archaeon]|nr:cobalamin-dependent protein [Candidatus Woesearchaeota archaeon]
MNKNICFISLSTIGMEILSVKDSITVNFIKENLNGFEIDYLPEKNISCFGFDDYLKKLKLEKYSLIAVSAPTFSYPYVKKLSDFIRKNYSELPIILGGPHVQKETIKKIIEKNIADLAISGSIDSFIIFIQDISKYDFKKINNKFFPDLDEEIPEGIYFRNSKLELSGKGISKFRNKEIPFLLCKQINDFYETELLLNNLCQNNCGYCNSPKNKINVPIENYLTKINSTIGNSKIMRITLYDNNPLWKPNRKRTLAFFDSIKKGYGYIPNTVLYGDPGFFLEDYDNLTAILKKYFTSFNNNLFFGRETVDGIISKKIKRTYCNEIRDQDRLDKEKEILLKIINGLNNNFTFVINYILTPFETYETLAKLINEVKEFSKLKRVIIRSNYLWPLPGTYVSEKYKGQYVPPDELDINLKYFNLGGINYWNNDFLDLCFAMKARIDFDARDLYFSYYNISMIELIKEIYFKKYNNKTIEKISEKIPDELSLLKTKLTEFERIIEKDRLYEINKKNKLELMRYSHLIFFNLPSKAVDELINEFKKIIDFKDRYFKQKPI